MNVCEIFPAILQKGNSYLVKKESVFQGCQTCPERVSVGAGLRSNQAEATSE